VVEYSEWLLGNVLKEVPHRQWVFSIPKRLRIYFLYDRRLLSKLSKCAWKVIRTCHQSAVRDDNATPGASIAVHTYGDFLNFNPHLHAIVTDGCFLESGGFRMAPWPTLRDLGEAFRHAIFSMLKKEGKITDAVIENMMSWHHSGFHVHIGERIWKNDVSSKKWRKNWARLIQKIYEVDPLICPKCQGGMRIIAFIEDDQAIKKILKHLGLWETRLVRAKAMRVASNHDPPGRNPTHIPELTHDDDYSQIPAVDYWIQ
jgi:hypothetical protein